MKRSRSLKKVSWASDNNLCQARVFLSKDRPSQVWLKAHDHIQARTSRILHSDIMDSNDFLLRFENRTSVYNLKKEESHIPQIKWKCPPKFVLSSSWLVACGEESQEAKAEKLREKHVLEAVYPCMSVIPPSPAVSLDVEECHQDDCKILRVPIIAIEVQETQDDTVGNLTATINTSISSRSPALNQGLLASGTPHGTQHSSRALEPPASEKPALGMFPHLDARVIAATCTTAMKFKEQGSLIDTDLLVELLTNPKLTEKLMNDCRAHGDIGTGPISDIELDPRPDNENMLSQPNWVQPDLESGPPQQDISSVSRSKLTAHLVSLPSTNRNLCPLPTLRSDPLELDAFPISWTKPDTVTVYQSMPVPLPVPLAGKGSDMFLLSKPANGSTFSTPPNNVWPAIKSRSPQQDTISSSSEPTNGSMRYVPNEPFAALYSRPSRLDTIPISRSRPISLTVPFSSGMEADMVESRKLGNENSYPLLGRSWVTSSRMHLLELNPVPGLIPSSISVGKNLQNPTSDAMTTLPDIFPMPSFSTVKTSPIKDTNYYRSLVMQHGGEEQYPRDHFSSLYSDGGPGDGNESPRVRLGSILEAESSKRMKVAGKTSADEAATFNGGFNRNFPW